MRTGNPDKWSYIYGAYTKQLFLMRANESWDALSALETIHGSFFSVSTIPLLVRTPFACTLHTLGNDSRERLFVKVIGRIVGRYKRVFSFDSFFFFLAFDHSILIPFGVSL